MRHVSGMRYRWRSGARVPEYRSELECRSCPSCRRARACRAIAATADGTEGDAGVVAAHWHCADGHGDGDGLLTRQPPLTAPPPSPSDEHGDAQVRGTEAGGRG